jgi:AAHS family 4-hydroxybenzoate transporter-like MFS transporter
MAGAPEIEVSRLLDERGLGAFQVRLLFWAILLSLIDGYDIAAIAFAAPHLVASWGIPRSALGPVLSASNIGVLFGSAIFGWVGDRYGRKPALIGANILFGVFTFIAAYSTDLTQLFWLRLIAGLGIGGVIPNLVAICTESAPRNLRATLPIVAVGCVPLGGALGGVVSAFLVPQYGWQILFQIGGVAPIVIALAAIMNLPESIKYMALHESQRAKMTKVVAALRPGFTVPPDARFVIEDERQTPSSNPVYLFQHGLWLITPLSWLLFALNLMGYFFLSGWTPTLLTAAKLPPATAAIAAALLQVGGTVGALSLCWWLQRHRFLAISFLFVRRPGRRLDRLCRTDVTNRFANRDLLRRFHRARHSDRHQRGRRHALSDLAARQRLGLAARPRPYRLDRRSAARRAVRRHAGAAALHVVGTALCRRRHRLLRHPCAQHGAAQGAPGTGEGAVTCMRHSGSCAAVVRNS